ncbi:ribosomal RNA small subunit methyltransferase A [Candidatus Uhrbacteria bacterium]|nr:ribosomal RNA small subunit methyltransferase A [Candidatus Uhrbacteria bacterium]
MPKAKKSLGQHFLEDRRIVANIVRAAGIEPGDSVLEIGPGRGILTQALVDAGAEVIVVETDADLIPGLRTAFGEAISLVEGDVLGPAGDEARRRASRDGQRPYDVVANIPYYITSPILERFLSQEPRPRRLVLMVQKEVADRITARPLRMSLLSVACQAYGTCSKVFSVPRGAFRPMPKIDSAVIRIDVRPVAEGTDPERIIALAKVGFRAKRKQLHRNLADAGVVPSDQTKRLLEEMGKDARVRAETLSVQDWIHLFTLLWQTPSTSPLVRGRDVSSVF